MLTNPDVEESTDRLVRHLTCILAARVIDKKKTFGISTFSSSPLSSPFLFFP
jgi:hypothetical protein